MPPDGYDTVTLPTTLVQRLEELDGDSHAETIRILLEGGAESATGIDTRELAEQVVYEMEGELTHTDVDSGADAREIADAVVSDLTAQLPPKVAEEMGGMR